MDLVGYALIKKDATTGISNLPIDKFTTQPVRVMEFCSDGGVLVVNAAATGLATFDKCDVVRSFKCSIQGYVICPPDLNLVEQMFYVGKALTRKGGYNEMVGHLVIGASLHKGEFNDNVLWQKQ